MTKNKKETELEIEYLEEKVKCGRILLERFRTQGALFKKYFELKAELKGFNQGSLSKEEEILELMTKIDSEEKDFVNRWYSLERELKERRNEIK